ncbi:hypothetical protein [Pseudoalteromonas obscura]|uniref:Uncharacterized protein n=1 Tax=Pseudoalteromonas obscura TaxID=3048491 RepID=A0ABT7EUC0_9GAMM|nr:hypothetical protein [Pseudoalteromonas sp. P94(2023)]MDK2598636.1 hypothetical protein [Pseudoalteromonas sp. P94(2023)]
MTLIISKMTRDDAIRLAEGKPRVQCNCCKRSEKPKKSGIGADEWLIAAHANGWRRLQSEHFDFDCVCPDCVDAFVRPVRVAV